MQRRFALVVVLLLGATLLGPATASADPLAAQESRWQFCPICDEAGLEERTDASVTETNATVRIDRSGAGHWTVRYRLASNSARPNESAVADAVRQLAERHRYLGGLSDPSVSIAAETVTVEFTDGDFATRTPRDTFTVTYYQMDDPHVPERRAVRADHLTVRGPTGYRPVGPLADGQSSETELVFDDATRTAFEDEDAGIVLASERAASLAGPLAYDVGLSGRGNAIPIWDRLEGYVVLLAAAMGVGFTLTAVVGRFLITRRPPERFAPGGYVAGGLALLGGAALIGTWSFAWPAVALLALYGTVAVWLRRRADGRASGLLEFVVAGGFLLATPRLGFAGPQVALTVLAGFTALTFGAAVGEGAWPSALANVVPSVLATAAVLALAGPAEGGALSVAIVSIFLTAVATLALLPAVLLGVAHGAPEVSDGDAARDDGVTI